MAAKLQLKRALPDSEVSMRLYMEIIRKAKLLYSRGRILATHRSPYGAEILSRKNQFNGIGLILDQFCFCIASEIFFSIFLAKLLNVLSNFTQYVE